MKAYRILNNKGEFVKTINGRSIWFNTGGIKNSINFQSKYWGDSPYSDCTIVEYEIHVTGKTLSMEDFKKGVSFNDLKKDGDKQ